MRHPAHFAPALAHTQVQAGQAHKCRSRGFALARAGFVQACAAKTITSGRGFIFGSTCGNHKCATCDGPFFKGAEELVVIGGGNSAAEEGLFLTKFAKRVIILVRGDRLTASKTVQDEIFHKPEVQVQFN